MTGISYTKLRCEYSRKEISSMILAVFSIIFIFFLLKWRMTDFSIPTAISYIVFLIILIGGATYLASYLQKRTGMMRGYDVEYTNNSLFLILGIVITFLFQAGVLVLVPGMFHLSPMRTRLGYYRVSVHERDIARVALYGSATYFSIGLLLGLLYLISNSNIFREGAGMLAILALFSLIPTPKNSGIAVFKWSPLILGVCLAIVLLYLMLILLGIPSGGSILLAALLGAVIFGALFFLDLLPRLIYGS